MNGKFKQVMVNNSTNINKVNNYQPLQIIKKNNKKNTTTLEIRVLT